MPNPGSKPEPFLLHAARLAGRALRLRCPNCGRVRVFRSWFKMLARCPECGLALDRGEQGYVVGAYMFNIAAAEAVFVILFVGVLVATWPTPPWRLLTWGAPILMVVMPLIFYPFSKTLFLALDLLFHPATPPE
jgi:uncharacterized protein (DUF983 family)